MTYSRYGVYFTPRPGNFADAGASWLGWDIARGEALDSPEPKLTVRPRKYGFHATMKPPFFLASGQSEPGLRRALASLCRDLRPVPLEGLKISKIGSFLALTALGDQTELAELAASTVRDLDVFRAPPSDEELMRRRRSSLSAQQEENLKTWGYPNLMESFHFHMTLTGPVAQAEQERTGLRVKDHFAGCRLCPFLIDSLTLVGESAAGMFLEIERFSLSGSSVALPERQT
ncbi:MAG: DUF1045 domain-containing protein [Pseudomonadota bacterium]